MSQNHSPDIASDLIRILDLALREDQAADDLTTSALPFGQEAVTGTFLIKKGGVVAGFTLLKLLDTLPWIAENGFSPPVVSMMVEDGEIAPKGTVAATLTGSAPLLLALERSMLNLISHLSGIATLTRRFVDAVEAYGTKICDTRKTLAGLRSAQKYAVKCGGGVNHRFSLGDEAMIKENHLALSGLSVEDAISAIRSQGDCRLTCECESLGQVESALNAGADCLLLDNFQLQMLRQAVSLRKALGKEDVPFEASGGVNLNSVAGIAETGVERISIGALTHSAGELDISFKIQAG